MILLRRIRAVGVVSALFGVSAAVISATINFGLWLQPEFPRSVGPYVIFSTVPFAFLIGCLIGVAFSALLSMRRARSGEALRMRWLVGAGLLGGAAVGLAGSFVPDLPRDLLDAVERVLPSVGMFALIGAGTAGLVGRIARGSGSLPTNAPVDRLAGDPASLSGAAWPQARGTPDRERDPRSIR